MQKSNRNTPIPCDSPPETTPASGSPRLRKNTKRWCKGKQGVEHVLAWKRKEYYLLSTYEILACVNCGKIKDYRFG